MNITALELQRLTDPTMSQQERARYRCTLAKELEEAGNYEAARTVMGELWQRVGERPLLDGLDESTASIVLLRAGALTGWLGSKLQVEGAQEASKDLISESITRFEALGETTKAAEALTDLSLCYWREGAFDEAYVILKDALKYLTDADGELKVVALLRYAIIERRRNRLNSALNILTEAARLVESTQNDTLKGRFHIELANTLSVLGFSEKRDDYQDRSLLEFAAANYHFEQAGNTRSCALVENNLGFLFFSLSRYEEANLHLDRARRLFLNLKEQGSVAQVDESRSRVLLAQGRNSEAERLVRSAVHTLQKGGELALLAEALTTHGASLARLKREELARAALERAIEVGEQSGDLHGAGRAALTMIEELSHFLDKNELRARYERADQLLSDVVQPETLTRLRNCARRVFAVIAQPNKQDHTKPHFVYASEKSSEMLHYAQCVAATDRPVLVTGETGTGKEIVARLMHEWSGRGGKFVAVNCAALCDTLVESQLFGHRKGSFTDAGDDHQGFVLMAEGGTLFLDEVGELSPANQAKLLRLIECGEIYSVGAPLPQTIDVRIIAATNHDLKQDVARGLFRTDLFYRLGAFHVEIPPLRERPEDIPAIAQFFIDDATTQHQKRLDFTPDCLEAMKRLPLVGNARELRTLIERTFLMARDGAEISAETVEALLLRRTQQPGLADVWTGCMLDEEVKIFEGNLIRLALSSAQGHLTRAARLLGITHQRLSFILNGRHKELLGVRKPPQKRRASMLRD